MGTDQAWHLLGLNWVQTVCNSYQRQMKLSLAGKELTSIFTVVSTHAPIKGSPRTFSVLSENSLRMAGQNSQSFKWNQLRYHTLCYLHQSRLVLNALMVYTVVNILANHCHDSFCLRRSRRKHLCRNSDTPTWLSIYITYCYYNGRVYGNKTVQRQDNSPTASKT